MRVLKLIRGDLSLRAALMRQRVADVQRIDKEILRVQRIVEEKVRESGTTLTTIPGVGALIAARLLGEVGDIRKIRSKAAFGHITGTAHVPASSGTTSGSG